MELVEKVIYTASLVTNPKEIDETLDTVRLITARIKGGANRELSDKERAELTAVQKKLEEYLVTRETVRSFTPESLQVQIEQHLSGAGRKKSRIQLAIILGLTVVAAIFAGVVVPRPTIDLHVTVGIATFLASLGLGAAWLFVSALHSFKSELRRAYILMCIAMVILSIGVGTQPLIEAFDLRQFPIVTYSRTLILLIGGLVLQFGVLRYVKLVGVKSWWATVYPILVVYPILAIIAWLAPHPPLPESELLHDAVAITEAWLTILPVLAMIILPMAISILPDLYKRPVKALFYSMIPVILLQVTSITIRFVNGEDYDGPLTYLVLVLAISMMSGFLRAGYIFNKVSRY